jgi:phenylacetate-CoA ligase
MVDVIRVHASSGTTGKPSYVGVTAADAAAWAEVAARVYYCEGMRPDDVVLHGFGLGFFVGGLPLAEAVQRLGATFIPLGTGATDRLVSAADDLGATVLSCNADLFPMYAGTCEAQDGNHLLAPDQLLAELVDPDSGESLAWEDGSEGELVATHLARECVPLVRFRTRDRIVVRTDPCSCGRTGPRIRCIGRTDDLLIVNGVNVWPSAVSDVVASMRPQTTGALEIVVRGRPPKVEPPLRVRVEFADGVEPDPLARALEERIRSKLIARSTVEPVPAGTLERTEAKSRLVRVESANEEVPA